MAFVIDITDQKEFRVYVEGVLKATIDLSAYSSLDFASGEWSFVGSRIGENSNGFYDDVIVTEGVKYTSNFTPAPRTTA